MSVVLAAAAPCLDETTRTWVSAATAHARFAGPDGGGVRLWEQCGLGHRLLRLSARAASGPTTRDGRAWISGDARLDDRASLITALRARRCRVDGDADDVELVLLAYGAFGEGCLERLAGDFAVAVWDAPRRRLLCAVDQMGIVPLHYVCLRDHLLVATSPEMLLLHPSVSARLDDEWVADFLLTGVCSAFGPTAFADVRRLPPGHLLSWSASGLRRRRYWRPPDLGPLLHLRRRADYPARFRRLLAAAVGDRITPGPLAVQLSGGLDSTTIAALAHGLRAARPGAAGELRAVTAVLGGASGDDEGDYAALVADALGIPVDVVDDARIGALDPLAEPRLLTPEPTPYQWTALLYEVMALAAGHAPVCLSGFGADPLLGTVPWYWAQWLATGHPLRLAVTFADHVRLFADRPHLRLRETAQTLLGGWRAGAPPAPAWLDGEFARRTDAEDRWRRLARPAASTFDKRSLSQDPCWQMWFTWGDPSYTRLRLRMRHPFMDLRLLDFAARIAPHPWFEDKLILREAAVGLLPEPVRRRPKTGLVAGARPSTTPQARSAVMQLIAGVPEAERFLNRQALVAAVQNPNPAGEDFLLARPIGLVYWLRFWQRPTAGEVGVLGPEGASTWDTRV